MGSGQTKFSPKEATKLAQHLWDESIFESLVNGNAHSYNASAKSFRAGEIKMTKTEQEDLLLGPDAPEEELQRVEAQDADPVARENRIQIILARQAVFDSSSSTSDPSSTYDTERTKLLLKDISEGRIVAMTNRFYRKMFRDRWLDKFIANHLDPHGERLAAWIIERMDPSSKAWSSQRPCDARTKAHRDAWLCPKRAPIHQGRRFKLDDCRMWMRTIFWAVREEGLIVHQPFWEWFIDFISTFIAIYEITAPPYTLESAKWSENPENIAQYILNGRIHLDIIGDGMPPDSLEQSF